jgi:hypothetical protein
MDVCNTSRKGHMLCFTPAWLKERSTTTLCSQLLDLKKDREGRTEKKVLQENVYSMWGKDKASFQREKTFYITVLDCS